MEKMLKKLEREIEKKRRALIERAKKTGIYENFGQSELTYLKDVFYDLLDCSNYDVRMKAWKLIDEFERWACNYSL